MRGLRWIICYAIVKNYKNYYKIPIHFTIADRETMNKIRRILKTRFSECGASQRARREICVTGSWPYFVKIYGTILGNML